MGDRDHPASHVGGFQVSAVAGVSGVLCPRDARLSYDLAREFLPEPKVKGAGGQRPLIAQTPVMVPR